MSYFEKWIWFAHNGGGGGGGGDGGGGLDVAKTTEINLFSLSQLLKVQNSFG